MVRTSAPGSAIHTTPSGAPQQTSGNVGVCQDYLNTLIKQAQVQPPQILKNVLDMIQGLIDNKVEPQTFIKKIQVELPSSKQLHSELPYLEQIFLPFLKTNLPGLRQALTANTMPIDGVTAPPVAVIHQEVSMETRVHPSVPPHLSTQHAAAVGGPHIPSSSAHPVGPQQSVTMQPRPQQNVTMQPRPQQNVTMQPRPQQNVTMQPRPQQNVTMQPRPQQSVKMQPRPQQSVTIQHPNSIVTERGIPQHTVVTTATPIPSMVRTSAQGSAIHTTPSDKAGASLSNWRTNEVPGELAGLSGTIDVSKQKPQSLIVPDEVKGQQSQPTEQAVRDASPAPSKSSTPSTTPTKIDKVEDTQAKRMAFTKGRSVVEDKDKVAIICKNVPPQFNTNQKVRQHFSKFGKVTRVFRRPETGTTTIHFETHEAALDAKRRGSMIMDGEKRLEIFWSSRSSMKKPLGHKSSTEDTSLSHEPIKRQVQDKAGASLSNWRTKEVPGELAGLSGTIDVSKQKPQSLIGPDEVKGQQSQPTEQAVRDASPAPSKSSTPSTTPTKIDKVEDTQAKKMAFARRLSVVEDKDKVAIICKNVPPQFNTNQKLRQHFSKFGKVTRVFRRPERGTATIHFETHEAALDAKRRGSMIMEGEKRLDIVWSFCSPVKKPLGHKSSTEDTSLSHRPMKRQAEVEDTQAKRMAFTKGRSVVEDKDKVAIICKNVPPQFNTNHKLRQHFSKFGKVTRVFPKLKKGWVIIHFETHEAALDAKRLGSMIMEGEQRLDIFWSSHSPGKKLLGHKSSTEDTSLSHEPIKRQAQDSSTRKRVKKTGEEVPSKKRAIEVVGLTPSPKETVTSDVSIPQESQTIKQDHLSNGKELSGEGSKENYQSSSSVSALEEKSKHKPKKKKNASNSTMEDLHQLKVFYEMEPLEMNTFFEMVKSKDSERRTGRKIEETMKIFKQITEEQLGMFRIDLDDLTETKKQNHQNSKSQKQKVMRLITTSTDEIYDFSQKTVEKKKYKDPRIIGLLTHWTTAVTEFMQNCADVVHSILQPEMLPRLLPSDDEVEEKPCEILYRNLFLSFSRIFLLRPRQQRKVQEKIRKNIVACVSDICFLQSLFQPCTDAPKLVLMCEVKRKEPFKHERPQKTKWIEKKIDPNVMGQIGMELLCESTGSFFSPSVAGIACLRSEIMFLFLDIAKDHHQAIKDDASLDGKHAKIFYTETYDILKPEDRSKFMDILLYFAAIQSCNFIYPL